MIEIKDILLCFYIFLCDLYLLEFFKSVFKKNIGKIEEYI